jgi:two-component system phosphate regulon sensor histidine kinase PhoR
MTLVEDILFISKADTGQFKLRFAVVDLYELVAQVLNSFQATAQRAQVELRADLPDDLPTIYADELRVQQVLGNLVNNAIKFTPPGGIVTISARANGPAVCLDVSDTGEGVPLEEQERLFERFYQSESTARSTAGGYGLGLAIAKLIVQQHGGRIWVQARPGQGSTFSFTIPLEPEARVITE